MHDPRTITKIIGFLFDYQNIRELEWRTIWLYLNLTKMPLPLGLLGSFEKQLSWEILTNVIDWLNETKSHSVNPNLILLDTYPSPAFYICCHMLEVHQTLQPFILLSYCRERTHPTSFRKASKITEVNQFT